MGRKKKELLGEETFTDLLTYFQKKINDLDELPGLYKSKCKERIVLAKQIYQKIKHLGETYSKLYEPVQQFIQTHSIAKNKFVLNFDVSIVQSGFKEIFFDQIISHGVAGSFCGIDEGNKMLDELITLFNFNDVKDVMKFPVTILDYLNNDKRPDNKSKFISKLN